MGRKITSLVFAFSALLSVNFTAQGQIISQPIGISLNKPSVVVCTPNAELAQKCEHKKFTPKDEVNAIVFAESADGQVSPGVDLEWNHLPAPGQGFEAEARFLHEDGEVVLDKLRASLRTGNVQVGGMTVGTGVTFLRYDALLTGSFRMRFNFELLGADSDLFVRLPELGRFSTAQQTEFYKGVTAILQRHGKVCDLELETREGLPGDGGLFYYVEPEGSCGHITLAQALNAGVFGAIELEGYRLPGETEFTRTKSVKVGLSLFWNHSN